MPESKNERLVDIPNLPCATVKSVAVSARGTEILGDILKNIGVKCYSITPDSRLDPRISDHPDMLIHHLGGCRILVASGYENPFSHSAEFEIVRGRSKLSAAYPGDIPLNFARVGNAVIGNFRYCDPVLIDEYEKAGIHKIDVAQGYAKCSVAIVDENSIITEDEGIARAVEENGIACLLIPCGEVELPGFSRGFVGGASVKLSKNVMAFTGRFSRETELSIKDFCFERAVTVKYLTDGRPIDFGSIFPLVETYQDFC